MGIWLLRLVVFTCCALLLTYGLFRQAPPPDLMFTGSDKLWHVLGFAALALTARLAFLQMPGWLLWGLVLLTAPLSEWLQSRLQPVRQFSWHDVYANLLGVLLALLCWWLLQRLLLAGSKEQKQ